MRKTAFPGWPKIVAEVSSKSSYGVCMHLADSQLSIWIGDFLQAASKPNRFANRYLACLADRLDCALHGLERIASAAIPRRVFVVRYFALSVIFCALFNSQATAAGFAYGPNFLVFTPDEHSREDGQAVAEYILARANQLREEIAIEWLGEAIPQGIGRTSINVNFNPGAESALTWAKDRADRTLHSVYLRTTPDRVEQSLEEMLPHEMVHVVFATRFPHPNRLPAWIEEGIASRYDDSERKLIRQNTVRWFEQTNQWPQLVALFQEKQIDSDDAGSYAAAASLVDYLLSRQDRSKLIAFARDGQTKGWDNALRAHYGIESTTQLQQIWQTSTGQADRVAVR